MLIGMGCRAISGEPEENGRRCSANPGAAITDIGPEPGLFRAAARQKRHCDTVAMQAEVVLIFKTGFWKLKP
jgi:hypothetical protein